MQWLTNLFARRRRYDDLSVSINEHLEEKIAELMDGGMTRKQAEQAARREFGNVALIQERSREQWQWSALESILADLKFSFRRLLKSPGFAITVFLTLAIGIGANTAVFSVVNSVLLKPLRYPDSERLIALTLNAPGAPGMADFSNGLQMSPSMYLTIAEHNKSFESVGIRTPSSANVTGVSEPDQVKTEVISDGVLQSLAVPATLGRWFSAADQDPHGGKTVMLSYGYWQRRFGGDRAVIGRSIQVDAQTREIVGVMPQGFRMVDHDFDLLLPMALDRATLKLAPFGYDGIARLKPGVTLPQADADVAALIPLWMDSWSNGPGTNNHYYKIWNITPRFRSLKDQVIGNVSSVLWVVMATVGLVMLIACTNIANLLLVRADARQQELSIRSALGAGRWRIARELLVESLLLGLLGGMLAVGAAYGGLRLLTSIGPANLPRLNEITLDTSSLVFALLLSVFSGLFFGSIPVLKYVLGSAGNALVGSARTASLSRARHRSRNLLVVAQVAMALVLLVCAALMIRTFAALRNVEPGFADAPHVQTMSIWVPDLLVPDPQSVTRTQNQIADKIAALPGVTSVGFAGAVPMDGNDPNWDEIHVEHKNYQGGEPPIRLFNYVAPGFFKSMGTRIVAGRDFTWDDIYGMRPMVMVSENFARESWGSASAGVGKRVRQFNSGPWLEVIGVVEDVRQHGVDQPSAPTIYWPAMLNDPYTQQPTIDAPRAMTFAIHSSRAGTEGFVREIQQAVWSVNPSLPLATVRTMQDIYGQSLARTSFTLVMLAIAGAMALALGIIGIYGVISYAVAQRTREIGIRLALGAQKSGLKWMFVRSALLLTAVGLVIGIGTAAALTQMMKSLLFGISPLDPATFITVPLVLALAAALASYLPARRAASVDPVVALRVE
jgi:predicted permease